MLEFSIPCREKELSERQQKESIDKEPFSKREKPLGHGDVKHGVVSFEQSSIHVCYHRTGFEHVTTEVTIRQPLRVCKLYGVYQFCLVKHACSSG